MANERKTLTMSISTYERLKSFGNFGESFDDLLIRLMDNMERKKDKLYNEI